MLSVMDGVLDLHGVKRNPCWTQINANINIGDKTFTVKEAVDWVKDDVIVVSTWGLSY